MLLASVLTPLSPANLQLAAQCGVDGVVVRYAGPDPETLRAQQRLIESFGMAPVAVEGYLPIERIKLGSDDGSEIAAMQSLIRHMGDLGIPTLCYNFMSGTDWVRTRVDAPERGGARVTEFRLSDVRLARSLQDAPATDATSAPSLTQDALWSHLARMLDALLPVAEAAGVVLAMHPDDPPLTEMLGRARIMNSIESFERLMQLAPSPHNAICFCQGTFAEMGVDIPAAIRRLGAHIRYVHFRDIRGSADDFAETFHDNGQTDMAAAMRAYREIGFTGAMRPDHVPQFIGEEGEPGYTMLGRLFAFGYMRGLMDATA